MAQVTGAGVPAGPAVTARTQRSGMAVPAWVAAQRTDPAVPAPSAAGPGGISAFRRRRARRARRAAASAAGGGGWPRCRAWSRTRKPPAPVTAVVAAAMARRHGWSGRRRRRRGVAAVAEMLGTEYTDAARTGAQRECAAAAAGGGGGCSVAMDADAQAPCPRACALARVRECLCACVCGLDGVGPPQSSSRLPRLARTYARVHNHHNRTHVHTHMPTQGRVASDTTHPRSNGHYRADTGKRAQLLAS
jgi:hypothetical protein